MLRGERFAFDAESKLLYDAVAPTHTEQEFAGVLDELAQRLPGAGTLLERYQAFRDRFEIPKDRLAGGVRRRDRGLPRAHARAHRPCRPAKASRSST